MLVMGDGGSNSLSGTAGNDTVEGMAGNDTINGLSGNDILLGNQDDDQIVAGDGSNTVFGGMGQDTIRAGAGPNVLLGNEGNDIITAGSGLNTVFGGMGNDAITVGDGGDLLYGNEGSDTITAGNGNNTIVGGTGNAAIDSVDGADLIRTGSGEDFILGNGGDDTIASGGGNDTAVGGYGNDVILGQQGDDFILGNQGDDTLVGGQGNDTLVGGQGNDFLIGGEGNDVIIGSEGDDTASFNGTRASYTITQNTDGSFVLNGASGSDTVSTVEHFQFDDGTIDAANLIQGPTDSGGGTPTPTPTPTSVAPIITGTHTTNDTNEAAVQPFGTSNVLGVIGPVTVQDSNNGASDSATITLSGGSGMLSGNGLTQNNDGSYSLSATDPGTLSKELDALQFTPNGTMGETTDTTFGLTVKSSAGTTATDNMTVVSDTNLVVITPQPVDTAPVAKDDNYLVSENQTITVAQVQGVLSNDTDADGNSLTASLVVESGPDNGTLTLNSNGSLSYTPTNDYVGDDTFSYVANDGILNSDPATVTIDVLAPAPPSITTPAKISVNEANLPAGTNPSEGNPDAPTLSRNGSFTISAISGINHIDVNGTEVTLADLQGFPSSDPISIPTKNDHDTLSITGYTPTSGDGTTGGTVNFNYTLTAADITKLPQDDKESFAVDVVNNVGNSAKSSIDVSIAHDHPKAKSDFNHVDYNPNSNAYLVSGNIITGAGEYKSDGTPDAGTSGLDIAGADGPISVKGASKSGSSAISAPDETGVIFIGGTYGQLALSANGGYSYTQTTPTENNQIDVFNYTVSDANTNASSSQLTITTFGGTVA